LLRFTFHVSRIKEMYHKQQNNNLWHWFGLGLVLLSLLLMTACTPTETADATPTAATIAQAMDDESLTATAAMATAFSPEMPTEPPTTTAVPQESIGSPTPPASATPTQSPTPAATATPFVPTPVPSPTDLPCPDLPPVGALPLPDPLLVAYLDEGNLWLWREASNTAEPLTTSGSVADPQFLPGRSAVAYLEAGNLWLWQDGSQPTRLTDSGDVQTFLISDDAAVIAYTRALDEYQRELWAINSDGANLRQLVSVAQFTEIGAHPNAALATDSSLPNYGVYRATIPTSLQWQPGSHNLIFDTMPNIELSNPGGIGGPPTDNTRWRLNAHSGERSLILPHGQAGGPYWGNVSFAPDGRTFAIISDTGISLANSDGSNRRDNLITYPSIGLGHTAYIPPIYWSADSQFLRTIIPDQADLFGNNDPTFTIWQLGIDGTAFALGTFHGFPLDVTLSPDLSQVAFWKPVSPQSNIRELHIASVEGAWDIVYAKGDSLEFKGWSPDSRQFVYWLFAQQRPLLGRLCQQPVPLVQPELPVHSTVTWVSGNRVLLLSGEEQNWTLSLGTPAGAAVPIAQLNLPYYQWNR
jgi:hypothetical protein